MDDKNINLEKFLADAATVLNRTENELAELARITLLGYEQSVPDQTNGKSWKNTHLRQIGQHLLRLSEQSKALQTYIIDKPDVPLPDDDFWPRIRILQSHEEERAQLARELEDSVGQLLANAIFELASSRYLLGDGQEDVAAGLDALQAELKNGLTEARHFIAKLEPATILSNFGLGGGIRRYLERYKARTGIKTELRINTTIGRLPSFIEVAIFRIIQEALSNVRHHANATQVEVVIEEHNSILEFHVVDDGTGFVSGNLRASKTNLGLARMVDYAELLNSKLRILSELGHGTQVILSVPYPVL